MSYYKFMIYFHSEKGMPIGMPAYFSFLKATFFTVSLDKRYTYWQKEHAIPIYASFNFLKQTPPFDLTEKLTRKKQEYPTPRALLNIYTIPGSKTDQGGRLSVTTLKWVGRHFSNVKLIFYKREKHFCNILNGSITVVSLWKVRLIFVSCK